MSYMNVTSNYRVSRMDQRRVRAGNVFHRSAPALMRVPTSFVDAHRRELIVLGSGVVLSLGAVALWVASQLVPSMAAIELVSGGLLRLHVFHTLMMISGVFGVVVCLTIGAAKYVKYRTLERVFAEASAQDGRL